MSPVPINPFSHVIHLPYCDGFQVWRRGGDTAFDVSALRDVH